MTSTENMTMDKITITGLEMASHEKPTLAGHDILAYFTAEIGVFRIKGCALVRTNRDRLAAWLPNMTDPKARNLRSITIHDEPTRSALLQAALKTYRMMGGDDTARRSDDTDAAAETQPAREFANGIMLPPPIKRTIEVKHRVEEITE